MKKQYIFLILIFIILYLTFQIIDYKYKEYKIKTHINNIEKLNNDISNNINIANELINYKSSKAYKNKILKAELWYKNNWEKVIYLTTENNYNKYTKSTDEELIKKEFIINEESIEELSIFQKWIKFIFKKDLTIR